MKAVLLNTSLKKGTEASETEKMLHESARILQKERIDTNRFHLRDFQINFGITDRLDGDDDWPFIFEKIKEADIVIIGTPVSMGDKSSIASLILERLQGYETIKNKKGQSIFYNKVGGTIVAGCGDEGAKSASQSILYRLSMLGFTIPPHANAIFRSDWDNQDTNQTEGEFETKNAERMTYNLIHFAELLKFHPIPTLGNVLE
ncbi:flavodoxin family protein [Thalassobacillus hwangdonensis]|uniref:Flavodoxin family protein n=1 Tax=Thalassobacillus hwangdonensis TaxID=546108 RepID=A0ABW3KUU4_9BACI